MIFGGWDWWDEKEERRGKCDGFVMSRGVEGKERERRWRRLGRVFGGGGGGVESRG
jgi:hypothetical protein